MLTYFRSLAFLLGILLPALVPATQFDTGPVTSTTFTVALDFDGKQRIFTVEAKLERGHNRIGFLAVRSQFGEVEIPKNLFEDLSRPDLGTLVLLEIDPTIYLRLRYGNQSPEYGTGECSFEDTRFEVVYEIRDGRTTNRSFNHYREGPLDPTSGPPPEFPP